MSRSKSCPNCGREHGPLDACMLGVLAGIEQDRNGAGFAPAELALVDASRFWDEVGGPAVDWLESHVTAQKIEAGWTDADDAAAAASAVDVDQTDAEAYAPVVAERMGEQMIDWKRLLDAASDGATGDELADYNLTRERVEELELDPDAFDGENVDIAMQESILAVESSRTFEVVFGTGGPDVRLLVECDLDPEGREPSPRRVAIRYSWTGSREVALHGDAREAALEFARRVVPELSE